MWDVSQRELEHLWNQVGKKKREENERAGERVRELLESSRSKEKKKSEGTSGIKWK